MQRAVSLFKHRQRGFALLVTIVLVAFLVLILVGLATFTRVETRVADNVDDLARARQNALAALNIAIGELQKYTGPDQRSTAEASIGTATNGVGSPGASGGTNRWIGVWGNSSNPQSGNASTPALLQWLVSGNENGAFDPSTDVNYTAADFGQINTAPAAPAYTPSTSASTGLAADQGPLDANFTLGGNPAVLLAGEKSADTSSAANAASNSVLAPLVAINATAGTVPGLDAAATPTIGRYAWWVGDESTKARVDLVDRYFLPTTAMTNAGFVSNPASPLRLMLPQRFGVERITDFSGFPVNTTVSASVLAPDQVRFADTSISDAERRSRFYDITTTSTSVLSDALRGGLKRDLTFAFAQTLANYRTALGLSAPTSNALLPSEVAGYQGPTWEQLHSFANLNGAAPITPRRQTATVAGINPVLAQARLFFGGTAVASATPGFHTFVLHLYPAFVLANPYTTTIAANQYDVRIDISTTAQIGAYVGGSSTSFWNRPLRDLLEGQVFRLDCPDLAPGEARIFTLDASGTYSAVETYVLANEWDAGAAFISLNTGANVADAELYSGGNGVYLHVGEQSGGAGVAAGTGNTTLSGGGGSWRWTLLDSSTGDIYQRIEGLGFPGVNICQSTDGPIRGSNATAVDMAPRNLRGGFFYRIADTGMFRATPRVGAYMAMSSMRAPLVATPPAWNDFPTAPGDASVLGAGGMALYGWSGWYSRFTHVNGTLTLARWAGGLGESAPLPQSQFEWRAFDVPRASTGLVSIGQLMHFNATGHLDGFTLPAPAAPLASVPTATNNSKRTRFATGAYAIGMSRANPNVARDLVSEVRSGDTFYDLAYILNRQLFDGYFFSTYPQAGAVDLASYRLPNSRLRPFRGDVSTTSTDDFRGTGTFTANQVYLAARNLALEGGFNVNSTSEEAWTAFLSGLLGSQFNGEIGLEGPYVRSINHSGGSANADNGVSSNAWNGFRNLSAAQIRRLAAEVVAQVRARGPSVSVADFVNRRLVPSAAASAANGIAGPLESAVRATNTAASAADRINGNAPLSLTVSNGGTVVPTPTSSTVFSDSNHLPEHALADSPGWINQADLLQALAPFLTARGDTFRIRAYGETLDPVNSTPANPVILARAWCEAIVQRLPDYVDASDDAVDGSTALSTDNRRFGRKFHVISIRWLGPDDI